MGYENEAEEQGKTAPMTVSFAGQRLGYDPPTYAKLLGYSKNLLRYLNVTKVVTGMSPGFERAVAEAAADLSIPFVAVLAHDRPDDMWPAPSREHHRKIVERAESVVVVSKGGYDKEKMKKRGVWIVDNSDMLIVLWDGNPAGPSHAVAYAQETGKPVLDPKCVWKSWSLFESEGVFSG